MKFIATAAVAGVLAHVNAVNIRMSEQDKAGLWEVCDTSDGSIERACQEGLTCKPNAAATDVRTCQYSNAGEFCTMTSAQAQCDPNQKLECRDLNGDAEGECVKVEPSAAAWKTGGHFARSFDFEEATGMEYEQLYDAFEAHLRKLPDNEGFDELINAFPGQDVHETIKEVVTELANQFQEHKDHVAFMFAELREMREKLEKEEEQWIGDIHEEIAFLIQDLIDGDDPVVPPVDPEEQIHDYIVRVIKNLGEDWSEYASITERISDYVAKQVIGMDKDLLRKMIGEAADNTDLVEMKNYVARHLKELPWNLYDPEEQKYVVEEVKKHLYTLGN